MMILAPAWQGRSIEGELPLRPVAEEGGDHQQARCLRHSASDSTKQLRMNPTKCPFFVPRMTPATTCEELESDV